MTVNAPIRFFGGANTASGFVSFFRELYTAEDGWRVYLIRGGPGTGKSTLMRTVYDRMTAAGHEGEVLCCSSDPSSLDGVRFAREKLCLLDATAPHTVEPQVWGAVEQPVALFSCTDERVLHRIAPEVTALVNENRALHVRARRCLNTAAALLQENRRAAWERADADKIRRVAARIAEREWGGFRGTGRLTHRFAEAVTPEGLTVFYETVQALCPRIYCIQDEQGAVGRRLVTELARLAREAGCEGIVCPDPLATDDSAIRLILPEQGVAFSVADSLRPMAFPVYRRIHAERFLGDGDGLPRARMAFNRKAARELLVQARDCAAEAKAVHDRLEERYREATDYAAVERLTEQTVERVLEIAAAYRE